MGPAARASACVGDARVLHAISPSSRLASGLPDRPPPATSGRGAVPIRDGEGRSAVRRGIGIPA